MLHKAAWKGHPQLAQLVIDEYHVDPTAPIKVNAWLYIYTYMYALKASIISLCETVHVACDTYWW